MSRLDLGALVAAVGLVGCSIFNKASIDNTVFVPGRAYDLKELRGNYEVHKRDSTSGVVLYKDSRERVYCTAFYGTDPLKRKMVSSVNLDWNTDGKPDMLLMAGAEYKLFMVNYDKGNKKDY